MTTDAAQTLRERAKVAATTHDVWTWDDERLVDLALGNLESALARANAKVEEVRQLLKQNAAWAEAVVKDHREGRND